MRLSLTFLCFKIVVLSILATPIGCGSGYTTVNLEADCEIIPCPQKSDPESDFFELGTDSTTASPLGSSSDGEDYNVPPEAHELDENHQGIAGGPIAALQNTLANLSTASEFLGNTASHILSFITSKMPDVPVENVAKMIPDFKARQKMNLIMDYLMPGIKVALNQYEHQIWGIPVEFRADARESSIINHHFRRDSVKDIDRDMFAKIAIFSADVVYPMEGELKLIKGNQLKQVDETDNLIFRYDKLDGMILYVYRPLLLPSTPTSSRIRLLYHGVADRYWEALKKDLSSIDISEKLIIFAGALDAGLVASYHAIRVIRQFKTIAIPGKFSNTEGRVRVVTFDTPPPFTAATVEFYGLRKEHFIDFRLATTFDDPAFTGLGQCMTIEFEIKRDKLPRIELNDINLIIANQKINQYDLNQLVQPQVKADASRLEDALAISMLRATAATNAAVQVFDDLKSRISCSNFAIGIEKLVSRIKEVVRSKYNAAEAYRISNNLAENWALNLDQGGSLECRIQKTLTEASVTVRCSINHHVVAIYQIDILNAVEESESDLRSRYKSLEEIAVEQSMEVEEQSQAMPEGESRRAESSLTVIKGLSDPTMDQTAEELERKLEISGDDSNTPPPSSNAAVSLSKDLLQDVFTTKTKGIVQCLSDILQQRPELSILIPHANAGPFYLSHHAQPYEKIDFAIRLLPESNSLVDLYHERFLFLSLLSGPDIRLPPSCYTSISPVPIPEEEFRRVQKLVISQQSEKVFQITGSSSPRITSNRYGKFRDWIVKHAFARFAARNNQMYDCTKAMTRSFHQSFCPEFCFVWPNNFCQRVFIDNEVGIKFTIRNTSQMSGVIDVSKMQMDEMSRMNLVYDNSEVVMVTIQDVSSKVNYYVAFFLGFPHTLDSILNEAD